MDFLNKLMHKGKDPIDNILLNSKGDRRLLPDVPDISGSRTEWDRRGSEGASIDGNIEEMIAHRKEGIRYITTGTVEIINDDGSKGRVSTILAEQVDLSSTGMLARISSDMPCSGLEVSKRYKLRFRVEKGSMPEGMEMKVLISATLVRTLTDSDGSLLCGFAFTESLTTYAKHKKDRYLFLASALLLAFITFVIVLMRAESVIYFRFNKWTYLYSLVAAAFLLSRYLFGVFYKPVPIDPNFTPGVTIIIPCFNEEEWIQQTILSCMNQNYPPDKLEVIVVDDCSTDASVAKIKEIIELLQGEDQDRYRTRDRLSYYVQPQNAGKRDALVRGVEVAKHELVVFVDSDSFLDPYAIRHLVQPFCDPKMGGVAGRTDVANTYTNGLTKMQAVRYYIAFRVLKAAEGVFDCVTCLSGPLSCYRKDIVLNRKDEWLNQKFFGQKATFGDDRAMTNLILREYRTTYQDSAVCSTIVPNRYSVFLKQQMRWKRSWLRESLLAGRFMWRKEPFASVNFYIGLLVPILAPVVVIYNVFYVPLTMHVFPTTFLLGLLLMALLMSFAQLLLRKSTTWIFGLVFCLYYEAILLWQMPVAWVTFWKSTWGTRMTPSDVEAQKKKEERKRRRAERKRRRKEKDRLADV